MRFADMVMEAVLRTACPPVTSTLTSRPLARVVYSFEFRYATAFPLSLPAAACSMRAATAFGCEK
jgi:hypothetical protein